MQRLKTRAGWTIFLVPFFGFISYFIWEMLPPLGVAGVGFVVTWICRILICILVLGMGIFCTVIVWNAKSDEI